MQVDLIGAERNACVDNLVAEVVPTGPRQDDFILSGRGPDAPSVGHLRRVHARSSWSAILASGTPFIEYDSFGACAG